jgi:predicted TIM-barrel fold metal-dependent hydrolase
MAKAGFRIFDADCHVSEPPEAIDAYVDSKYKDALDKLKLPGANTYRPNQIGFGRVLGAPRSADDRKPVAKVASAPRHRQKPLPNTNTDPHQRIQDMDLEGIDTGVMLPTGVGSFCSVEDLGLEMAVIQAYHRYIGDFCRAYPGRLYAAAVVSARNIEASIAELKRVAAQSWPAAVFPSVPAGMPLDDPELDPLWKAAADLNLTIALHTFTVLPPYAPGALDGSYFDNHWLARSAAHPWCGMRNMASLLGSGVLDRYPTLRIAVLEAGQGWLPYWIKRLDEQAAYSPASVPPNMGKIEDYVTGGRYFQSIELHEGEPMTKYVIDQVGEDVLMFSSDYPHGETWFPEAVDTFLGWESISTSVKKKMFWENAIKCFPRAAG